MTAGCTDTWDRPCGSCDHCLVETALRAADAGSAGHWPTVAGYLADEVRSLRTQVADRDAVVEAARGLAEIECEQELTDAPREQVQTWELHRDQAVWTLVSAVERMEEET